MLSIWNAETEYIIIFYNNLGIRAVIVCFYFVLIGLIKGLMGAKIMKIFIPVALF